MKNSPSLGDFALSMLALHSRRIAAIVVALFRALFTAPVSRCFGVAALAVEPTEGDAHAATLAVAVADKPRETVGSIVDGLLLNRPKTDGQFDDVKVAVVKGAKKGFGARVMMLPLAAADAAVFGGGELVGTITRDLDGGVASEKQQTTPHTMAAVGGKEADPLVMAIQARLDAAKPRRNLSSLMNVIADAIESLDDADESDVIVFTQENDGAISIRRGGGLGTGAGKLADVNQISAQVEDGNATPSNW